MQRIWVHEHCPIRISEGTFIFPSCHILLETPWESVIHTSSPSDTMGRFYPCLLARDNSSSLNFRLFNALYAYLCSKESHLAFSPVTYVLRTTIAFVHVCPYWIIPINFLRKWPLQDSYEEQYLDKYIMQFPLLRQSKFVFSSQAPPMNWGLA